MKKNKLISFIIILLTGLLLYVGGSKIIESKLFTKELPKYYIRPLVTQKEGVTIPNFNILLSDSSTLFNIGTIPTGQPTVLIYFAPECPFCQAQIKEIRNNINELKNIRFYVFTSYSFNEMKSFSKKFELNKYSNIVTGIDGISFFKSYFGIRSIPFVAIYDINNKLTASFTGVIRHDQLKEVSEE